MYKIENVDYMNGKYLLTIKTYFQEGGMSSLVQISRNDDGEYFAEIKNITERTYDEL